MSEPPALPSAFGIEAVQWLEQGPGGFTVRVVGRWRRRRPSSGMQALLVVEAQGRRNRFPAMPEPPSIGGAAPGTWQMSFTVPAAFAPPRAERVWLQLGSAAVPLPLPLPEVPPEPAPAPAVASPGEPADAALIAQRRLRSSELALEGARRRVAEAERAAQELADWIAQLEASLSEARREPEQLRAELKERERARRRAEQQAHAERERRLELQHELAEAQRALSEHAGEDRELGALQARIAELQDELEEARRRADEAEHALAAAVAARRRAERAAAQPEPVAGEPEPVAGERGEPRFPGLGDEFRLARLSAEPPAALRRASEPTHGAAALALLLRERQLLHRNARRAPIAPAEPGAAAGDRRLGETLVQLRQELDALHALLERETAARAEAERRVRALERELQDQTARSARAHEAIGLVRAQLLGAPTPAPPAPPAAPAVPPAAPPAPPAAPPAPPLDPPEASHPAPAAPSVDPERLSAALSRLRETAPPAPVPGAAAPGAGPATPWLENALRLLLRRDPAAAGELLVALLPLQAHVRPAPIAYDLVTPDRGVFQITVGDGRTRVEPAGAPRPAEEVSFSLHGELPAILRLLLAGPIRRRLGWGAAQLQGQREALAAPRALVRARNGLSELIAEGLRTDALLAFKLVAALVAPAALGPESFAIAHRTPGAESLGPCLQARQGELAVAGACRAPVALTIACPPEALLGVLAGAAGVEAELEGDARGIELVRTALARAQRR